MERTEEGSPAGGVRWSSLCLAAWALYVLGTCGRDPLPLTKDHTRQKKDNAAYVAVIAPYWRVDGLNRRAVEHPVEGSLPAACISSSRLCNTAKITTMQS